MNKEALSLISVMGNMTSGVAKKTVAHFYFVVISCQVVRLTGVITEADYVVVFNHLLWSDKYEPTLLWTT